VIDMMRKLTAVGLTALAVAGLAGTGTAVAASSHAAKPLARVSTDRSSRDTSVRERESSGVIFAEHSTADRSHDAGSSDRAHHDSVD
jgi:hypothetical protein